MIYSILLVDLNIEKYDTPGSLDNILQQEFRNTLKPFYGVLKTLDGCIKFALLTKFGKEGVFREMDRGK